MLYPVCELTIGKLTLPFVHELHIESSWRNLTDTCVMELPRRVTLRTEENTGLAGKLEDLLQVGDPVLVRYGYGKANLRAEFRGYVARIKPGPPIELHCEDEMYWLKRSAPTPKSWSQATTYDVATYVRDQAQRTFAIRLLGEKPVSLGAFAITAKNRETGSQVFDRLRREYGLRCYFHNQELLIGDAYLPRADTPPPRHQLNFAKNIITNDLEYVKAADVRVRVHATSVLLKPKGKREPLEVTVPPADPVRDLDSTTHEYKFVGLSQKDLNARANALLKALKYTGYTGTVTTFGDPPIEHGDEVVLSDQDYNRRGGVFTVDKVVKSFGEKGSSRVVTLGPAVLPTAAK